MNGDYMGDMAHNNAKTREAKEEKKKTVKFNVYCEKREDNSYRKKQQQQYH